jgi:transposase-like protein
MADISNPIFHDEAKAIAHLEASRWPDEPFCPFCGSFNVHRMGGKTQAGYFLCNDCREKFTARVGSVMERSHIPVHKWLLAMHLMAASKKGMSAKQIERMLGVSYKSAWFLCHRIREAMKIDEAAGPIGGAGKIVESDETFVGGRAKNVHKGKPVPEKAAVHALVERGGKMRAKHVADVTAKTLRKNLRKLADAKSELHTDEALAYYYMGAKEFASHKAVNHSAGEYFRYKDAAGIQGAESFFAIFKRGVYGSFHSVSKKHLQRYLDEFVFRWNHRSSLGVEDFERAAAILKGIEGRRLTYRRTDEEGKEGPLVS